MSGDRGSVSNPGVELRDLIRREARKQLKDVDQVQLALVTDVADGVTVGITLDGFTAGEIMASWASPVTAAIDQRVTVVVLKGGQSHYVVGVLGVEGSGDDHGLLGGLNDDDHTQYHTDARGDALYVRLDGSTMTGLLVLSGAPAVDAGAVTRLYADTLISDHEALSNPHAVYLTEAEADALYLAIDGTADDALRWTTARTLTLGGDLTGNVSISGASNFTLTAVVVNDSHTHDGRYFTESESDARFVNHTGDQTMTGHLIVDSLTRLENTGTQAKMVNLASGGKTLIVGTASIAPGDNKITDLGSSGLRWNRVFADLSVGGSVPDTVRYRASDGQMFDGASTRKVKRDIRPLENSERIYELRPVSFVWKVDGQPGVGLIAEETFPLFPEVVSLDGDGEPKGVAYDWLVAPMLAELQNLAVRVSALESG